MTNTIEEQTNQIFEQIKLNRHLGNYVDKTLPIPIPFVGSGKIKLIVLGQDPTVKNPRSRQAITTVLNLDKNRSVRAYMAGVCNNLGIKITENVYATNLFKNFFVEPPTQIKELDIFQAFKEHWLPLLMQELSVYPGIPIITLGQPILTPLIKNGVSAKVGYYWGYTPGWKVGRMNSFKYIQENDNHFGHTIFPYPHQPSLRKEFYKVRMKDYTAFVRGIAFS